MKYAIRHNKITIGVTALEFGDPPMGFVYGAVEPTQFYSAETDITHCKIYLNETNEEIPCEFVAIEDFSAEMGEQCIEVTALISSAEDYEKFFGHHLAAYEKQFIRE